jgi:hypothetical protein
MRPELDIFQFTLFIRQFGLDFKSAHFDAVLGFALPWLPEVLIKHNATQRNATQRNATQHNTIQYNTIQYNTIQYNTIQYNII